MNSWEKERAEQEAADQAEERRVAREARAWEEVEMFRPERLGPTCHIPVPPYLFVDERSQRRVEDEARHHDKMDDYAAWQDEAVGAEERFR